MAVIVTGGAGFIGSHLVERLIEGETVVIFDNLATGSLANVERAVRSRRAVFVYADVAQPATALERLFAKATREPLEAIYHLASPANAHASSARAWTTLASNGFGTMQLAELAERHGATFLYASASDASARALDRESGYAVAKRFGEATTLAAVATLGVRARIARVFETYGPRMHSDDGIVPKLLAATTTGLAPASIDADPSRRHGLTYVNDVVDALTRLAAADTVADAVDIGCDDDDRVANVIDVVGRLTNVTVSTHVGSHRDDEPLRPSTEAARRLGWSPRTSLEAGLRETIAWHRDSADRLTFV